MPGMGMSWFVEDISLFSTTLRSALTNEISTVSNGSIANARITNCARSMNAIVHFPINFHIRCHRGKLIERFRQGIDFYIDENPQVWDSVLFFRCDEINTDRECVTYMLCVRSRYTWQVASRVLLKQGELHRHCIDLAYKLRIHYDSPNARNILYHGGSLIDGGVQDFKANVLSNSNIINDGSTDLTDILALREGPPRRKDTDGSFIEKRKPRRSPSPLIAKEEEEEKAVDGPDPGTTNQDDDSAGRTFLTMLQESHQ
jgi:Mechanosensitive ion channel